MFAVVQSRNTGRNPATSIILAAVAFLAPIALAGCGDDYRGPFNPADADLAPVAAKGGNGGSGNGNGGGGNGGGGNGDGGSGGGSENTAPIGRLYFATDMHSPGNQDIYVVNPDGTGLARLTTAPAADMYPRAAAAAPVVAFIRQAQGMNAIYVMNGDGTNQRQVYAPENVFVHEIAISADGTKIAFTARTGDQTDIWTIGVNGSGLTRVTNDAIAQLGPAWSPRGREIAFAANVNGRMDIYEVTVNNGRTRKLTNGEWGGNHNPTYSPDGKKIAFSTLRDGNFELYAMGTDGSKPTKILATVGWAEFFPAYSPDGRDVAYISQLNSGGRLGMRWTRPGTNNSQTGPVSTSADIHQVTWGL